MTKDLALLVGADQKWLSTTGFLDKISEKSAKGARNACGGLRRALDARAASALKTGNEEKSLLYRTAHLVITPPISLQVRDSERAE